MFLINKVKIISLILTASLSQQLYAQEPVNEELKEVVIFTDRLDLPVDKNSRDITIITAQEIQLIPARSINDILSHVSGVDVRQRGVNGAQADISIDGGTFDQIIVLINGHKMSDPQTGHNMMNVPIVLEAIERIEILRGPAASRYGVNGLAGVVNVVTKNGQNKELLFSAYIGSNFQSDSSQKTTYNNFGVHVTDARQIDKWQHLAALSYDKSNGYRENSSYQNFKAFFNSTYEFNSSTRLILTTGYVYNKFDARDYYAFPRDAASTEQIETYMLGIKLPMSIKKGGILQPYVTYRYGYDDYIFVKNNPSIFRNQHHTHVIDGGIDYSFNNKLGKNAIGINTRHELINSTNLGERKRSNWGVFIENYNRWSELDLRWGVFADYSTVYGFNVYPQIELGKWMGDKWRIYANAGLGQRLPTFTDLYYTSPNNIGNEELSPEKAFNSELGGQFKSKDLSISLGAFYRVGYDMIDWIRKDTSEAWQVYNFSRINTLGIKANVQYTYSWDHFTLGLKSSYTYLSPEILNTNDPDRVNYMSQYSINALKHHWVNNFSFKHGGYNLVVTHRLMNRYVSDVSIHPDLKSKYNILDVKIQKQTEFFNIGIQVQNALNTKYIEAGMVTMPGTWATLSMQYRLK